MSLFNVKTNSIKKLYELFCDDKIDVDREYQRGEVWTDKKCNKFLDTIIMTKFHIPVIAINKTDDGVYHVIDGKQRLTTIFSFINNKIKFNDNFFNKTTSKLVSKIRNEFLSYKITVVLYNNIDYEQECEVYERINNGESHSKSQKRVAKAKTKQLNLKFKELKNRLLTSKNSQVKSHSHDVAVELICICTSKTFNMITIKNLQKNPNKITNKQANDAIICLKKINRVVNINENNVKRHELLLLALKNVNEGLKDTDYDSINLFCLDNGITRISNSLMKHYNYLIKARDKYIESSSESSESSSDSEDDEVLKNTGIVRL